MTAGGGTRIAGLDLVRGVAIALVLVRHAWPAEFGSAGIAGVVAFFALSGYLITGILLHDLRRHGRVRYGRFYRNRALRLLPPLLLLLAGIVVAMLVWDPLGDRRGLWRMLFTGLTYTGNLPYNHGSATVGHLWTLATEEQFYLLWPVLLAIALRWNRVGTMVAAASTTILVGLAATMWLKAPGIYEIYPLPTSWAIAIVIGAAARIWEPALRRLLPERPAPRAAIGTTAVAALLALALVPEDKSAPWVYLALGPSIAAVTVVLVLVWSDWVELPTPVLRPLLALGTVSYAAYLWNWPIVMWLGGHPMSWQTSLASIALTIGAATASWWLLERPVQRWRARRDARRADAVRDTAQADRAEESVGSGPAARGNTAGP
ncbi:hypothetical protein GCM10009819_34670 [Agromyces tropicus]|uniref:Acyltransferase 3 domain-containing protein n=1 Tax=Agromyces tropicus TaxID=555371 RepID=A0ABN2UWN0_9MICO